MRWFCIKKGAQKVVKRFEIFWIFYSKHFFLKGREHYRSWDYSENFGIYSQLDRTSKTWFFSFPNLYFSRIKRGKILISQLSPPKIRYFTNQNGPKGEPHENEIWQLSNAKMGSFVWFSCLRPELWPLNLSFLQFFANVSKKPKAVTAIYVYVSKSSRFTFSENGIGYYGITSSLEVDEFR